MKAICGHSALDLNFGQMKMSKLFGQYAIVFLVCVGALGTGYAQADTNDDIYNGIIAESQHRDSSVLEIGFQGRALMFMTAINAYKALPLASQSPFVFTVTETSTSRSSSFVGTSVLRYMAGITCVELNVSVTGRIIQGETRSRYFVDSFSAQPKSIRQCV